MLYHFFGLWIYEFEHDVFAHTIVGLFETIDKIRVAMVMQVRDFLSFYNLLKKLIAIMKDESGHFLSQP
jgi:hypothetical protein